MPQRDGLASELASTQSQLEEARQEAVNINTSSMDAVNGLEQEVKHLASELSMAQVREAGV